MNYSGVILGFYWGNIGIMEKMEATIWGLGFRVQGVGRPYNLDPKAFGGYIGHPWTPYFGNTICAASGSHLRRSILDECAANGTRPGKFALAQDVPYDDFPEEAEARNSEHTAWAMNLRAHAYSYYTTITGWCMV